VPGVEPGRVRETLEDLGLHVVDQLHERRLVAERVADAARKERRLLPVNTPNFAAQRVVLYARISEDATGEGIGVARQLQDCRELAELRGWSIVAEATDNDISALRGLHRPGYQQVLELVRRGAVDHVVVWQTSRLLRNRRERAEAIELFARQRVGIIAVKGQDLDLSTAYGRGIAGMLGEFDTMESEVKSERVLSAAAQRARAGRPSGSLGYGWQKSGVGSDATYTVHPVEGDVVREVTRRLLGGESLLGVTANLNERGIPAPAADRWGKTSVKKIALRPANAGLRIHHRGRPTEALFDGVWPPLVSREEWQKLHALFTHPARRSNGAARPGARRHLLTWGIGVCGVCGGHLRVAKKGNANWGVKKHLYVCDEKGCTGRDQANVDKLVGAVVIERLARPDAQGWLLGDDEIAKQARQRASALREQLDDAADAFSDLAIDKRQLERITARLLPQWVEANEVSKNAQPSIDPEVARKLAGSEATKQWANMTVAAQRAVLEVLGIVVTINRVTRHGPGFDPSSVAVKFL
jgi:site-specific DNA recombinase